MASRLNSDTRNRRYRPCMRFMLLAIGYERALAPETWSQWALVILAGFTTFFAVKGFLQTRRQADAAEAALEESRRAAQNDERTIRLTERADILLDSAGILPTDQPLNALSEVLIVFKNFGRTRANNTRLVVRLSIPDTPEGVSEIGPIVVGTGDSQRIRFAALHTWITELSFTQILRGQIQLRFEARVTYEDVFGNPHTTYATGFLDPRSYTFHVERNEAD